MLDKADFLASERSQCRCKLIKNGWEQLKIFDGDANPLYDAIKCRNNSPKYVKQVSRMPKKVEGVSEVKDGK